jgi:hypothetical protein
MTSRLRKLWRGELPLADAFWNYAIIYGSILNLLATIGALAILAIRWPALLALAVHLAPLPYNVVVVVGVWRSAGGDRGSPHWALLARILVIVWAAIATLA